ncbi:DNA polymerase III subunit gamma/tau [Fructobacillus sp. M1-13]|uniref:DNA-directed DNA polymerase n=1 Tax=Fructobacillus papyriferae TaxID=2713171 RepID=A0ABS5QPT8_9LACO|nr:DNA polymerase III subunit gamma/tau [Fructobacillus papyriferae]MBS9335200.1 DNA polymerase III subunit gamma/tau [Fructobacillus papyriferae]MCD2159131.1 DNA polymerase III subunit gamma/tau [Fructobacillus papyriferae]
MAYQALYRVYRPKTFSEMVGQEVITKTLQNAIDKKQTGHAYLFAGPRGTGKTSAAKIFAREVNGISADQAGKSQPDIIEIDAASNNGVDEIRSIRDSANYAPIKAPYKIYIIDEAHMLSTGAFNALLKTLEEPPAQVKFILATTEIQKMPATILSRTQRFEFKRLSNQTIKKRLEEILQEEKQAYEEAALDIVATAAEGGMRDALSIMDQVIAFGPDKVTVQNALTVTGSVDIDQVLSYLQQVLSGDTAAAMETLSEILLSGKDANRFLSDLIATLRDVMLVDLAPDLVKAKSKESELKAFLAESSQAQIQEMLQVIDQIKTALTQSLQSDIYLEILTVQLAQKKKIENKVPASNSKEVFAQEPEASAKPTIEKKQAAEETLREQAPNKETLGDQVPVEKAPAEKAAVAEAHENHDQATGQPGVAQESKELVHEQPAQHIKVASPKEKEAPTMADWQLYLYTGNEPVQAVLAQAKRDQLNKIQSEWPGLVAEMPVKDQAILQTAEPVAASLEATVLSFDYPALQDKAEKDNHLQEQLAKALDTLHLPKTLVLRSQDQWKNDRADYVKALKAGQTVKIALSDLTPTIVAKNTAEPAADSKKKITNEKAATDDIVAAAQALFGDELVQVEEDHS